MAGSKTAVMLLLKCAVFAFSIAILYTVLFYTCQDPANDYDLSHNYKMQLLAKANSPKVVFLGGSNVAFGINSVKIRQASNMPVVNTAVNAGYGLKFMLDQVQPYLKQGDIVVIAPEYSHFVSNMFYGNAILHNYLLLNHNYSDFNIKSLINFLASSNEYIFYHKFTKVRKPTEYSRDWFNDDGDVTGHLALPQKMQLTANLKNDLNPAAAQYLCNFIKRNSGRGVTTVVVYPCLQRTYYQNNITTIESISALLNESGISMASTPQDFVYDDDLFFDTVYHLNAKGRELRTENIIQALARELAWKGNSE